jgi:hypothetical protein
MGAVGTKKGDPRKRIGSAPGGRAVGTKKGDPRKRIALPLGRSAEVYLPKFLYLELNFSTRPALSRMRCLPV